MQRDFNMQQSLKVWTCVRVKCAVVWLKTEWWRTCLCLLFCAFIRKLKCQLVFQPRCAQHLVRVFLVLSWSLISYADVKPWGSPACATMPHLDVLLALNLVLHYYKLSHRDWWESELHNLVVWVTSRLYIFVHTSQCCHRKWWEVLFQAPHPRKRGDRHHSPGSAWVNDEVRTDLSSAVPGSKSSDVSSEPGVTAETKRVKGTSTWVGEQ